MSKMNLENIENLDILEFNLEINQSLFSELYNKELWRFYYKLGIINEIPHEKYAAFNDLGEISFDGELREDIFNKSKGGFFKNIFNSAKVSLEIINSLEKNNFDEIDEVYEREIHKDYSKFDRTKLIILFDNIWKMLLDNFKYLIISNLILENNLKVNLKEKWIFDWNSKKYNAILDLNNGNIFKKDFDEGFGFLAENSYDLNCPRYSELKKIKCISSKKIDEISHKNNFRDYVKFEYTKLIAILRKILLGIGGEDIFYFYKEEILSGEKIDINDRKTKFLESKKILLDLKVKKK